MILCIVQMCIDRYVYVYMFINRCINTFLYCVHVYQNICLNKHTYLYEFVYKETRYVCRVNDSGELCTCL